MHTPIRTPYCTRCDDSKKTADRKNKDEHKREYSPVQMQIDSKRWKIWGTGHGAQGLRQHKTKTDSNEAASERKYEVLRNQLEQQLPSARSQGRADGDFAHSC